MKIIVSQSLHVFLNLVSVKLLLGNTQFLKKNEISVSGIKNSPMPVAGVFEATVFINKTRFKNVGFHVLEAEIPVILGLKFLRNPEILNFTISRKTIHFELKNPENSFSANLFKKNSDPVLTISNSVPPTQSQTEIAKNTLGIQIAENANIEHSEKIANLLLSFKDVFGLDPEKTKLGNSCGSKSCFDVVGIGF